MEAGCDDYLTKPIKTNKLLDSIEKQFFKTNPISFLIVLFYSSEYNS